jgi:hypothetical protein
MRSVMLPTRWLGTEPKPRCSRPIACWRCCAAPRRSDHRIDNDVAAVAKLPAIRDLTRAAIVAHTGAPFENPLFPINEAFSPGRAR